MVAASRAKSSDRAAILKKLLPTIKKHYKVVVPKHDRPVLETMLFAICLEDASVADAEHSFARLGTEFPDLNEIRVSSIMEIERAFVGQTKPEWRAFHVRNVLQYVFEKSFAFEFESLRKKTLELAQKQLAKIKHLSGFVRSYTLQSVIGAHLIPLDEATCNSLIWLGLVPPNQDAEQMSETLKSVVRKSEVPLFCSSLRCLATDKNVLAHFDTSSNPPPEEGYDGVQVAERLVALYKAGPTPTKAKSTSTSKSPEKKQKTSKATKPTAPKASEKPAKKPAAAKGAGAKKVAKKAR